MADIEDVLDVVAAQVTGFVYPAGTGAASVTGKDVNVFPGWPLPEQIDKDMPSGIADVSVYPYGVAKNTTRYQPRSHVMSVVTPTLTLTATGSTVTVGGAMPAPFTAHNMAVLIANKAFIYPVQASDTLTSIATGLAALIAVAYPGTGSVGPVVTLASDARIQAARVGTTGVTAAEWERQDQTIMITVWAPDPATRKQISSAIKVALSQIAFLTMPDGFGARIRYRRDMLSDQSEKSRVYRRDLYYDVEYATTVEDTTATVVTLRTDFQTPQGAEIRTIDS